MLFMTIIICIIVFIIIGLGVCAAAIYIGLQLTHPKRKPVDDSPKHYGICFENIEFMSRIKDVLLKGWLLIPDGEPNGKTIVCAHGYSGNRLERGLPLLALAPSLLAKGYRVLMFDFRNSGESEGKLTTVGYLEKQDLLGAIDWVREQCGGKICLLGFSMGGTTSLLAAADNPGIAGVVADSSFCSLKPYLKANLSVWSKLPRYPFTPLIIALLPKLTGINAGQVDALAVLDRIYPRPVLFIHSEHDSAIPHTNSEAMWHRFRDHFQLWLTKNADHVGSYAAYPQEYTSRILAFFEKC